MTQGKLEEFIAYQKARELFEFVANDMDSLLRHAHLRGLISQQFESADSICANIEEGFGRHSPKEYAQFLGFSRGSARETSGRYERLSRWLAPETIQQRIALCMEITRILTATIRTLRSPV
jgi:four helix bundle protein